MVEQILACLLAEMNVIREKTDSNQEKMEINQERMEAKIWPEIKTIQRKMDNGQEDMKGQVGSLASPIDVNQEEMKVTSDACLENMEANPRELQSVAVHQEVPKEGAAVEMIVALRTGLGTGI
jgi:hypothetical protein